MSITYSLSVIILVSSIILLLLRDYLFKNHNCSKYVSINKNDIHINHFPFKPKYKILSDYELRFYTVLKLSIIDTNYIILPKVRLSDILIVYDTNEYQKYYDHISSKSIDFLLCDKDTFKPLIAIMLDDSNLDLNNPFFKNDILTLIFNASAFKLVRFKKHYIYNVPDIKELLSIPFSSL